MISESFNVGIGLLGSDNQKAQAERQLLVSASLRATQIFRNQAEANFHVGGSGRAGREN